jgi:hypothetical protein
VPKSCHSEELAGKWVIPRHEESRHEVTCARATTKFLAATRNDTYCAAGPLLPESTVKIRLYPVPQKFNTFNTFNTFDSFISVPWPVHPSIQPRHNGIILHVYRVMDLGTPSTDHRTMTCCTFVPQCRDTARRSHPKGRGISPFLHVRRDRSCTVQFVGSTGDFVSASDRYSSIQALNRRGVPQR